jgi:hypothetical protein
MTRQPTYFPFRFLFLLPAILALGIWAGHGTLRCDLIEHHPDFPIEQITYIAAVPVCPDPLVRVTRPIVFLFGPDEGLVDHLPHSLRPVESFSRGPPSVS